MRNALGRRMRRKSLLLLCLALWVAPLPGATLERLSLDDVIQKSSDIVRAKVVGSTADFRGGVIYTHWKLQVTDRLKGGNQPALEVLVPGGDAQGFHQDVPGAPALVQGQEYLFFLWTARSGSIYITGLSQGFFQLSTSAMNDVMVTRVPSGETMLDGSTWLPVKDDGFQMRYPDMVQRISTALSQPAAKGAAR